jgi:hypothetical protein
VRGIIFKFIEQGNTMQDILSFAQTKSSPLSLSSSSMSSDATIATKNEDGTFTNNFFSMVLEKVTQENNTDALEEIVQELPQNMIILNENTAELLSTDQGEAKSIDEHLMEDLLSVVNALQQNSQTTTFPTLKSSSNLEKILSSETARQDFANVKSVSDLLDLSKKYNLGLEKLSISQESVENLQTKFPTLAQNNFFDDLTTALNDAQATTTQTAQTPQVTASTQINLMSLMKQQEPKEQTTQNGSILSELFAKTLPSEPQTAQQPTQTSVQQAPTDTLSQEIVEDALVEQPHVNEKQQNDASKMIQTLTEDAATTQQPLEAVIQKVVQAKPSTKKAEPTQQNAMIGEEETATQTIKIASVKTEPAKTSSDDTFENIVKPLKAELSTDETNIAAEEEIQKTQVTASKDESTNETTPDTQEITDIKTDLNAKVATKQETTANKTLSTKETLSQFAGDLKEQIETYKPPIMKVELSLSPKSLGDVDVTLLTRGNNLHVNISSNTTTMNLFTQNQDEVKSALVNMGFTNLEMNFSDQRHNESQQNNQNRGANDYQENFADENQEETTLLEIVIPQYV